MRSRALLVVAFALGCSRGPGGAQKLDVRPGEAVQLVAGYAFNCVLARGAVRCCGQGWEGELGNGGHEDEGHLVDVAGLRDVVRLAAGGFHACALTGDGSISCWGEDKFEQLGYASWPRSEHPRAVERLGGPAKAMALGIIHSCAVMRDATVRCWGANNGIGIGAKDQTTPPRSVDGLAEIEDIAAAASFTCARRKDGAVLCWGDNHAGQLGDGTTEARSSPVRVAGVPRAVELALADDGGCARVEDGSVWCWGGGAQTPAKRVDGITDAVEISAREMHVCARTNGGAITCFSLAHPERRDAWPAAKPSSGWRTLAVGGGHTCAIDANGALVCEGTNLHGELCDGSSPPRSNTFPPPP